jgi:transcriptional regulator of acetoin/glycerol metabolism
MSRTAEVLGVERSNLYKKLKAFGITPRGTN